MADEMLNWLWQGGVVALATVALLRVLDRAPAGARWLLCVAALLAVLALPPVSLARARLSAQPSTATPTASRVLEMPRVWWTSTPMVLALWAMWSSVHGIRVARALIALRRARAGCRPFPATLEARLRYWNQVKGRRRRASLLLSHDVRTAGVLGSGFPVIALAPVVLQHLSADELDRLVIHEWAHVQRRDDLVNLAQLAVRVLAGWHPAAWWLDRQLLVEREAACDEIAVALTGCPKRYAASLTTVASLFAAQDRLPTPGAMSSPRLTTRVHRILSDRQAGSKRWSAGAVAVAVAVLATISFAVAGYRLVESVASSARLEAFAATTLPAIEPKGLNRAPPPSADDQRMTGTPRTKGHSFRTRTSVRAERAVADTPAGVTAPLRDAVPDSLAREELPSAPAEPAAADAVAPVIPPPSAMDDAAPATPQPGTPTAGLPPQSAWAAAAEAGVSIARTSQKAGVTTAALFNRFGRKIARSF